jgi:hypothetical protein
MEKKTIFGMNKTWFFPNKTYISLREGRDGPAPGTFTVGGCHVQLRRGIPRSSKLIMGLCRVASPIFKFKNLFFNFKVF